MEIRREHDAARLIRRRDAMLALGGAGLGAITLAVPAVRRLARQALGDGEAWAADTCELSPEQTEGPYYIDGAQLRRNVTESRPGVPLLVSLEVNDAQSCAPIPGAVVEIWHADAGGSYSGFNGADNATFMRGSHPVGAAGVATFRTVYPGWYRGRTVHIHVKVHVDGNEVHTGQLYFDDALSDTVFAQEPYASRGTRDTRNANDGIFANGGAASTLTVLPRGKGYWGTKTLVVAT